jgi:hypothetical protein
MANVEHSTLTGSDLHESKGVAAAANNRVYVTNGAGSGAFSQVPAAAIAAAGVLVFQSQMWHARNELSSGTDGGTLTDSTWNTRAIDTEKTDDLTITLSGNQFTLAAGTYYLDATITTNFSGTTLRGTNSPIKCAARLRNITDSTTTLNGLSSRNYNVDDGGGSNGSTEYTMVNTISGRFTIVGSKTFEIQTWPVAGSSLSSPVIKAGKAVSSGENEVYLDVKLWKTA